MWINRAESNTWKCLLLRLQQGPQKPGVELLPATVAELLEQQRAFVTSPPREVAEALAYLCQQLTAEPSNDAARLLLARTQLCQLITAAAVSPQHAALPGSAAHIIMPALRRWADTSPSSSQAVLLQHAALSAIAALIPKNLTQLQPPEAAALLAVLNSAATTSVPSVLTACSGSSSATGTAGEVASTVPATTADQPVQDSAETVHLALSALSQCFPKSGAAIINQEAASLVLTSCLTVLHAWCTGRGRPEESPSCGKLYISLTRLLATLMTEARAGWAQQAALLVDGLRRLLTYGATAASTTGSSHVQPIATSSAAASPAGGVAGSSKAAYRPPHLRESSTGASRTRRSSDVSVGDRWSDSELSDNEGGGAASNDRMPYHRVRLGALLCIQTMAKADSRAMHSHWTSLLPVQQPLQPRPLMPHIVTLLLHDPVPKVRSLAAATIASLLEGTASKGYLVVAEARAASSSATTAGRTAHISRGFTTLSTSLGQLLLCTHAGLLAGLHQEQSSLVVGPLLHALCVLMRAAPVERLPGTFLPQTLQCLSACKGSLLQSGQAELPASEQHAILAAYMACLAEVLTTRKAMPVLATYLNQTSDTVQPEPSPKVSLAMSVSTDEAVASAPLQAGTADAASGNAGQQGCVGQQLAGQLLESCAHPQAIVRIEALAALRGLLENCDAVITQSTWEQIRQAVDYSLSAQPSSRPPSRSASSSSLTAQGSTQAAVLSAAASSTAAAPEDKARQHAIKLLAAYLTAMARQQGCGPTSAQQFNEGDAGFSASGLVYTSGSIFQTTGALDGVSSPPGSSGGLPSGRAFTNSVRTNMGPSGASAGIQTTESGSGGVETARGHVPASAVVNLCKECWQQALGPLLQAALQQPTPMVKAAALTALCDMPEAVLAALPENTQQQVLAAGMQAIAKGAAQPAVCAAGCKLLGAFATFSYVLGYSILCSTLLSALPAALQHAAVSVRVAAAWAVACAAETLTQQSLRVRRLSAQGTACVLSAQQLQLLRDAALTAAQGDGEKVRAHGMRAVAALLSALPGPLLQYAPQDAGRSRAHDALPSSSSSEDLAHKKWLTSALGSVQSGMTTGNAKVQWSACVAAQAAFSNPHFMAQPDSPQLCSPLLLILLMLVRECTNYKVRAQAAAALASLQNRHSYGVTFPDAITVVCAALDSLENSSTTAHRGSSTASMNASTESCQVTSSSTAASTGQNAAQMGQLAEDSAARSFPNFKHLPALVQQLRLTLIHLLGLVGSEDGIRCKELLAKRWEVVEAALEAVSQAAVQTYLSNAGCEQTVPLSLAAAGDPWDTAAQQVMALQTARGLVCCGSALLLQGGKSELGQEQEARDMAALLPLDLDQAESGTAQALQPQLQWTRLAVCLQAACGQQPALHGGSEQQAVVPTLCVVVAAITALQTHVLPSLAANYSQHSASVSRVIEALGALCVSSQPQAELMKD